MSRQIEPGSIVLSQTDVRILYQVAHIRELRQRHRSGSTRIYELLTDITVAAFRDVADPGNEPRQPAATEEREWWTTEQLARSSRRAARTIRHDIATGALPATKTPGGWFIRAEHAHNYLDAHSPPT